MRELSEDDIQAVLGVVEGLALDAADGDTSIPQERLARIMAAVRYCMGEGEACLGEASGESLARRIPADELYRAGYDSIVEKARRTLERYNQVASAFCDYGYEDLGRTFREEIPEEMSRFDPRFEPDAEVIFGYPMPQDDESLLGIDAIAAAIERIGREQEVLAGHDGRTVAAAASEASAHGVNLLEAFGSR
jgi:hypothetical protein